MLLYEFVAGLLTHCKDKIIYFVEQVGRGLYVALFCMKQGKKKKESEYVKCNNRMNKE